MGRNSKSEGGEFMAAAGRGLTRVERTARTQVAPDSSGSLQVIESAPKASALVSNFVTIVASCAVLQDSPHVFLTIFASSRHEPTTLAYLTNPAFCLGIS